MARISPGALALKESLPSLKAWEQKSGSGSDLFQTLSLSLQICDFYNCSRKKKTLNLSIVVIRVSLWLCHRNLHHNEGKYARRNSQMCNDMSMGKPGENRCLPSCQRPLKQGKLPRRQEIFFTRSHLVASSLSVNNPIWGHVRSSKKIRIKYWWLEKTYFFPAG
jgi:hypothetical protein